MQKIILVLGGLLGFGILGMYFVIFHGSLSTNASDWGSFGGYISGTLTILALSLTIYIGLETYNKQKNVSMLNMLYNPALMCIQEIESLILHDLPLADASQYKSIAKQLGLRSTYILDAYAFVMDDVGIMKQEIVDFNDVFLRFSKKIDIIINKQNIASDKPQDYRVDLENEIRHMASFIDKVRKLTSERIYYIWKAKI